MKSLAIIILILPLMLFSQIQTNQESWTHESGVILNSSNSQCVRVVMVENSAVIIPKIDRYSETLAREIIIELPVDFPVTIDSIYSVLEDMVIGSELTEEEFIVILGIYLEWEIGYQYDIGDVFKYDSHLYKVNQAHTSQSDWIPGNGTDALYSIISPEGVIPDWVQPQGAHDAYNIGDLVQFNGYIYESKINANVWSPSAYPAGWQLIE